MRLFSLLIVGAVVNSVGTGVTAFALAVHMFELHGSATAVALVTICGLAPVILLAPIAGVLADRYDRRTMMIVGDGGSLLGLALVAAGIAFAGSHTGLLLGGVLLSACFAALTEPALRASVAELVGEEDYVRASGMLQLASAAKLFLSPVLAGLLMPLVGVLPLLAADAATAVVTVACAAQVRKAVGVSAADTATSQESLLASLAQGWRFIAASARVRTLVALVAAVIVPLGAMQVLLKPMLLADNDPGVVGMVESSLALGLLCGAAAATALKDPSPWFLLVAGLFLSGVAMVGAALRAWPWWVGLAGIAVTAGLALAQAGADAMVRASIPNNLQARVWGLISLITQLGYPVAAALAGPLADRIFEPNMAAGGAWSTVLGPVFGVGDGRGCAVLIAVMGALTLGLAGVALSGRKILEAR